MNTSETGRVSVFPAAARIFTDAVEPAVSGFLQRKEIAIAKDVKRDEWLPFSITVRMADLGRGKQQLPRWLAPAEHKVSPAGDVQVNEASAEKAIVLARKAFTVLEKAVRCSPELRNKVRLVSVKFVFVQKESEILLAKPPAKEDFCIHDGVTFEDGFKQFKNEARLAEVFASYNRHLKAA